MKTTIVVPCYNEEIRFEGRKFNSYLEGSKDLAFVFVDDGSTDNTGSLLRSFCENKSNCELLTLGRNQGKAEAVRQGMSHAIQSGSAFVGYWDCDLSTPLEAIDRFVELLKEKPSVWFCSGARIQLLGKRVVRKLSRHYLGRVFATAASMVLGIPVYDTQCGAKLMRVNEHTRDVFETPFLSRWVFDVELFMRLKQKRPTNIHEIFFELPLDEWIDRGDSKVKPRDFFMAFVNLLKIYFRY